MLIMARRIIAIMFVTRLSLSPLTLLHRPNPA